MNIQDFPEPATPLSWPTALAAIFARQRELMNKYKEIEGLPDPPLSVHHAHGQRILKDFAWRCTEELTESAEAFLKHRTDGERDHGIEELADALHFLVELLIFAGVTSSQCMEMMPGFPENLRAYGEQEEMLAYWEAVYELGVAMNFLRNKPWKQSQVPTDERRFRAQLLQAFKRHIELWAAFGLGWQEMHSFYFRKSEVNRFRQRSQY